MTWLDDLWIVLDPDALTTAKFAALELQRYLSRVKGEAVRIVEAREFREPHHFCPMDRCVFVGASGLRNRRYPELNELSLADEEIMKSPDMPDGCWEFHLASKGLRIRNTFDADMTDGCLLVGCAGQFTADLISKPRRLEPGGRFEYAQTVTVAADVRGRIPLWDNDRQRGEVDE